MDRHTEGDRHTQPCASWDGRSLQPSKTAFTSLHASESSSVMGAASWAPLQGCGPIRHSRT